MERETTFLEKNGILYQFTNDTTDLVADKYRYMWQVVNQNPQNSEEMRGGVAMAKAGAFRSRLGCGYQTALNGKLDQQTSQEFTARST